MQRDQIEALIPVREPYLWVDEVIEVSATQIHARKRRSPAVRGPLRGLSCFPRGSPVRVRLSGRRDLDRANTADYRGTNPGDRPRQQRQVPTGGPPR